jgi:2-polyprenyl-3-methyl-5-hydroxy-6-metoxy-1,4-benzoquinol methylase
VADWYDDLVGDRGSEYHQHVILPGLLRMLGAAGLNPATAEPAPAILDLACGQGVLCRYLSERGFAMTGVDAAGDLIEAAKRRSPDGTGDIRYLVADVTELVNDDGNLTVDLEPGTFDAASVVLAMQNISGLSGVWRACRAAVRPGGFVFVVIMHPCFRIPKHSDWHWDDAAGTQSRQIAQYLTSTEIPIETHPGLAAHGKDERTTTHFHRPLQAYINTLGNAGLLIDHIEEWTGHKREQPGPKQEAIDRARKEIPMFLALRARKI